MNSFQRNQFLKWILQCRNTSMLNSLSCKTGSFFFLQQCPQLLTKRCSVGVKITRKSYICFANESKMNCFPLFKSHLHGGLHVFKIYCCEKYVSTYSGTIRNELEYTVIQKSAFYTFSFLHIFAHLVPAKCTHSAC